MHNHSSNRFKKLLTSLVMGARLSGSKKYGGSTSSIDSKLRVQLSDIEIELLLNETEMTREEIVCFHENFIKDCPNGYVTKKDFIRMFKELHQNNDIKKQKCEKFCEFVFNAIDYDSNNIIEFTDFLVCFALTSYGNLRKKIELAFKIYDIDKNLVIDKHEMLKVIEALYDLTGVPADERKGINSPKSKVDEIIKKLDKNSNNVLEFDEFLDGCMSDEQVRKILVDPMYNC